MVRLEGHSQEEVTKKDPRGASKIRSQSRQKKSAGQIIRDNVFTYFNPIFLVLAVLLVAVKSWNNLLFVPVVVVNSLGGVLGSPLSADLASDAISAYEGEAIVLRERKRSCSTYPIQLVEGDLVRFQRTRSMRMGSCWRAAKVGSRN